MYSCKVEASFEAAHRLPDYQGPCRAIHGHHWVVQATWERKNLDNQGMAIDFVILKRLLRQAIVIYDHKSLNSVMNCTPTAENLARQTFDRLRAGDFGSVLTQVSVEETPGNAVVYREDDNARK